MDLLANDLQLDSKKEILLQQGSGSYPLSTKEVGIFSLRIQKLLLKKEKKPSFLVVTPRKNVKSFEAFSLRSKRLQLKNDLKLCKIQQIYKLNSAI